MTPTTSPYNQRHGRVGPKAWSALMGVRKGPLSQTRFARVSIRLLPMRVMTLCSLYTSSSHALAPTFAQT
jgi:hypothetical protein